MKTIYICSRFSGNIPKHIERAFKFSQAVYLQGHLPICVHTFLESVTGLSELKGDRPELLSIGLKYLKICDECWVLNIDGISEGMNGEIEEARKLGKEVKYFFEV